MSEVGSNREQRRAEARRRRRMAAVSSAGVLAASGVAMVSGSVPAGAAAFVVDDLGDSGAGTLRQAILDANANGVGLDQVTFQPGLTGPITLLSNLPTITGAIDIQGPGADVITVDGNANQFQAFNLTSPGTSSISGLTVTNGDSNNANGDDSGGAVSLYDTVGSLTLSNMVITGNTSGNDGGGVHCLESGDLVIEDSVVSGNHADEGGGGLYVNECDSVTISTSTFSGNDADGSGGGLYLYNTNVVVRNSTISGNEAGDNAGGVDVEDDGTDSTVTFLNSTISGNTAGDEGGGFYVDGPGLTLLQTTVTGNTATTTGGIYSDAAGALSTSKAGKRPEELAGRGGGAGGQQTAQDLDFIGSIIADNTGFDLKGDGVNGIISSENSLLQNVDAATIVHDQGGTITGVDPELGPLADNGGPTLTHALLANSPAINAGPDPLPPFTGDEFDQRGADFVRVVDGVVDIGAFEVQPPPEPAPAVVTVTPTFTG